MRILLRNLIDNAVRYSPTGRVVRLAVTSECTRVVRCWPSPIRDQDLAPAEREKVWQRFYRILSSGETGSGLGLSIVKCFKMGLKATKPCVATPKIIDLEFSDRLPGMPYMTLDPLR